MSVLENLPAAIPFDQVEPQEVPAAIRRLLGRVDASLRAVVNVDGPRTWANTGAPLDRATEPLDRAWTVVSHLRDVCASDAIEAAYNEVLPEVAAFYAGVFLREDLFAALTAYAGTADAATQPAHRRRWLDRTLDAFRRNGAALRGEAKDRYKAIVEALAMEASAFMRNVMGSSAAWSHPITDPAQIAGLPPSALAMLETFARSAGQEQGWRVLLVAPAVTAILTYAEDRELRRVVWHGWNHRATSGEHNNAPVIERMLNLRREQATLLGFGEFADFVLADRMARTGAEARAFVARLEEAARPAFDRENDELRAFAAAHGGPTELLPWDVAFWAERQRRELYDFDEEAVRPWFAYDSVLAGMFELASRLYGVQVQPLDQPGWHADVRAFAVREREGHVLGTFYTDFFPRKGKRDGAWMNPLQTADGAGNPHVGIICGDLTPPGEGRPSLLTHREVETLFHEFGHLLHHLLTRAELYSQAGTNVAWDFVELPSQIMENWTWERGALDLFARHHVTGEPLPDELFERMTRARRFRGAAFMMRQLGFCKVDLDLHAAAPPDAPPVEHARRTLEGYSATPIPEGFGFLCAFSHLFADAVGYAAGYYSYQWAAVLDADAFSRFQREGLFNAETGAAFRDHILSAGNSDDPAALFRRFLGRDPDVTAHLTRSGLLPAA